MSVYFPSPVRMKNDGGYLATQYCDGLRGAFIIYDPQDPHKHLYDIDDGKFAVSHTLKILFIKTQ